MNNKSAKYIIKKFSVIGDRRFGFSCHFEAHQRLLSLQISQPYLFMHWKKSVTSFPNKILKQLAFYLLLHYVLIEYALFVIHITFMYNMDKLSFQVFKISIKYLMKRQHDINYNIYVNMLYIYLFINKIILISVQIGVCVRFADED